MKLWLTSFMVLLALFESSQWLKHIDLPLPVLLLGGAVLAVVSNGHTLFSQPNRFQLHVSAVTQKNMATDALIKAQEP
jgi:hypothetical protein